MVGLAFHRDRYVAVTNNSNGVCKMKASRKKEISKLIDRVTKLKTEFEDVRDAVETVANEEREQYDSMSEKRQESDAGQAASNAAGELEEAYRSLNELDLDAVIGNLDNAKGEQ